MVQDGHYGGSAIGEVSDQSDRHSGASCGNGVIITERAVSGSARSSPGGSQDTARTSPLLITSAWRRTVKRTKVTANVSDTASETSVENFDYLWRASVLSYAL
jgi:hypothetical protein